MPYTGTNRKIERDESLMETMPHGRPDYPFIFYDETMKIFDFFLIDWHWHTELEFMYQETGEVQIWVGTEQLILKQGQGIFINTRALHRFLSKEDAAIPNFLFEDVLIAPEDSLIYRKYVSPVLHSHVPYMVFDPMIPWQKQVLSHIREIIRLNRESQPDELLTAIHTQTIWQSIFSNLPGEPDDVPGNKKAKEGSTSDLAKLQLMMTYIHENYPNAITLEEIARQALISKNAAISLFRRRIDSSPVEYLIRYRLKQAALLLSKSERKVGAIAAACGFESVDYFCRSFKKHYRMTPTEYRSDKSTVSRSTAKP